MQWDNLEIKKSLSRLESGVDRWSYPKLWLAWNWLEVDKFKKKLRGTKDKWVLVTGYEFWGRQWSQSWPQDFYFEQPGGGDATGWGAEF